MPSDERPSYNGVKVFSATTFGRRDSLGDIVTAWMQAHPECVPVSTHVRLSSDSAYHCLTIVLFWRTESGPG